MPSDDVYHPGTPVDLPVEHTGMFGREANPELPSRRTHVATELGIKIYFDLPTQQFHAHVSPPAGRGGGSELHSKDFAEIVAKIRERALVVPVRGYTVTAYDSLHRDGRDPVELEPVEVIEYHRTRQDPWVIRYQGVVRGVRTTRTRTCGQVYLPTKEQVDALRDALVRLDRVKELNKQKERQAQARVDEAKAALTTLDARTLRHIQKEGVQAVGGDLGLPVFDRMEDDDDADEDAQAD